MNDRVTPDELRKRRAVHGLSQGGCAKKLGVHQRTVSRWEKRDTVIPATASIAIRTRLPSQAEARQSNLLSSLHSRPGRE